MGMTDLDAYLTTGALPQTPAAAPADPKATLLGGPNAGLRAPRWYDDWLRALHDVPPLAGMVLGGMAGGGPTPMGVAGAGLGYAGGRAVNRVLGTMLGSPPPSGTEQVTEALQDVMVGAAGEMLPPVAQRLTGVGRGLTGQTLDARAAARRLGIDMTPAGEQGSPTLSKVQAIPQRVPLGRGGADRAIEEAQESLTGAARRSVDQAGGALPLSQAYESAQSTLRSQAEAQTRAPIDLIEGFLDAMVSPAPPRTAVGGSVRDAGRMAEARQRELGRANYRAAFDAAGPEATVPMEDTYRVATELARAEARLRQPTAATGRIQGAAGFASQPVQPRPGPMPVSIVQELIDRYGLTEPASRSLRDVDTVLNRLQAAVRRAPSDDEARQIRAITTAVRRDMNAFATAQGGDTARLFREADAFYRDEIARDFARRSEMTGKPGLLRTLLTGTEAEVGEKIAGLKNPQQIEALLRRLPARQQDEVRRTVLDHLTEPARKKDGTMDLQRWDQILHRWGDENLGYLLGPRAGEFAAVRHTIATQFAGREAADAGLQRIIQGSAGHLATALGKSPRTAEDLVRAWPQLPSHVRADFGRGLVSQVFDAAIDGKTKAFSTERWLTARNAIPDEVWRTALPAAQQGIMRDLTTVFQHVQRVDRASYNPSGTAQALMTGAQVTALTDAVGRRLLLHGDPRGAAEEVGLSIGVPYAIGRFVFSPAGRRFLVSPDVPAQFSTPKALAGLLYRSLVTGTAERVNPSVPPVDEWESAHGSR